MNRDDDFMVVFKKKYIFNVFKNVLMPNIINYIILFI
jgi:hypothetical protein